MKERKVFRMIVNFSYSQLFLEGYLRVTHTRARLVQHFLLFAFISSGKPQTRLRRSGSGHKSPAATYEKEEKNIITQVASFSTSEAVLSVYGQDSSFRRHQGSLPSRTGRMAQKDYPLPETANSRLEDRPSAGLQLWYESGSNMYKLAADGHRSKVWIEL